jgi:hypothetical protein
MRERAWEAFTRASEDQGADGAGASAREALDRALEAALAPQGRPPATEVLAEELRRAAITIADVDRLADHLVSRGYRRG